MLNSLPLFIQFSPGYLLFLLFSISLVWQLASLLSSRTYTHSSASCSSPNAPRHLPGHQATRFIRTQIVLFENRFSSPFLSYTLPSFQSMVHCPLCAIPTKPTTRSTPCFNNIHSYNKSNKLPKPPLFSSTRIASLSRRPRGFFGGKQELLLLFLSAASVVFCSVLFTLSINSTLLFSSPPFPLPYLFSA